MAVALLTGAFVLDLDTAEWASLSVHSRHPCLCPTSLTMSNFSNISTLFQVAGAQANMDLLEGANPMSPYVIPQERSQSLEYSPAGSGDMVHWLHCSVIDLELELDSLIERWQQVEEELARAENGELAVSPARISALREEQYRLEVREGILLKRLWQGRNDLIDNGLISFDQMPGCNRRLAQALLEKIRQREQRLHRMWSDMLKACLPQADAQRDSRPKPAHDTSAVVKRQELTSVESPMNDEIKAELVSICKNQERVLAVLFPG